MHSVNSIFDAPCGLYVAHTLSQHTSREGTVGQVWIASGVSPTNDVPLMAVVTPPSIPFQKPGLGSDGVSEPQTVVNVKAGNNTGVSIMCCEINRLKECWRGTACHKEHCTRPADETPPLRQLCNFGLVASISVMGEGSHGHSDVPHLCITVSLAVVHILLNGQVVIYPSPETSDSWCLPNALVAAGVTCAVVCNTGAAEAGAGTATDDPGCVACG